MLLTLRRTVRRAGATGLAALLLATQAPSQVLCMGMQGAAAPSDAAAEAHAMAMTSGHAGHHPAASSQDPSATGSRQGGEHPASCSMTGSCTPGLPGLGLPARDQDTTLPVGLVAGPAWQLHPATLGPHTPPPRA